MAVDSTEERRRVTAEDIRMRRSESNKRIEKLEEALEYIRGSLRTSDDETLQAIADIAENALTRTEEGRL